MEGPAGGAVSGSASAPTVERPSALHTSPLHSAQFDLHGSGVIHPHAVVLDGGKGALQGWPLAVCRGLHTDCTPSRRLRRAPSMTTPVTAAGCGAFRAASQRLAMPCPTRRRPAGRCSRPESQRCTAQKWPTSTTTWACTRWQPQRKAPPSRCTCTHRPSPSAVCGCTLRTLPAS